MALNVAHGSESRAELSIPEQRNFLAGVHRALTHIGGSNRCSALWGHSSPSPACSPFPSWRSSPSSRYRTSGIVRRLCSTSSGPCCPAGTGRRSRGRTRCRRRPRCTRRRRGTCRSLRSRRRWRTSRRCIAACTGPLRHRLRWSNPPPRAACRTSTGTLCLLHSRVVGTEWQSPSCRQRRRRRTGRRRRPRRRWTNRGALGSTTTCKLQRRRRAKRQRPSSSGAPSPLILHEAPRGARPPTQPVQT